MAIMQVPFLDLRAQQVLMAESEAFREVIPV